MTDPAVIRIFDTTLRDGEQSPGATLTLEAKLQVADQLVLLRVDIIEAGFPAASPGDLIAVKEIASQTRGVAVAALARANINDIDTARLTYEIMMPTSVGWNETTLVLGKHAGRQELDARLRQLGYYLNINELRAAYSRFVALAEKQKYVTDADLIYIAETSQETPTAV